MRTLVPLNLRLVECGGVPQSAKVDTQRLRPTLFSHMLAAAVPNALLKPRLFPHDSIAPGRACKQDNGDLKQPDVEQLGANHTLYRSASGIEFLRGVCSEQQQQRGEKKKRGSM